METQTFLNIVYDIIAQNPVAGAYGMMGQEHDIMTDLVDHVDTEKNTIVFINQKTGKEFELRLVETYAPSSKVARGGL